MKKILHQKPSALHVISNKWVAYCSGHVTCYKKKKINRANVYFFSADLETGRRLDCAELRKGISASRSSICVLLHETKTARQWELESAPSSGVHLFTSLVTRASQTNPGSFLCSRSDCLEQNAGETRSPTEVRRRRTGGSCAGEHECRVAKTLKNLHTVECIIHSMSCT